MTHKADTLRPFLRCAAVVLCSLALPLAVFALWDRALLAAPHTRTDGERFSAAGRANATACTLYAAEHVTKVPLGSTSGTAMVTVVPTCSVLVISSFAPCAPAMRAQSASPMPLPPAARLRDLSTM